MRVVVVTTLLLTQLVGTAAGGVRRLAIEYEIIESISPELLPAGLFDEPSSDSIVKRYSYLSSAEVLDLDFDVYFAGTNHEGLGLRSIL